MAWSEAMRVTATKSIADGVRSYESRTGVDL